jgi:RecB family exonuclease
MTIEHTFPTASGLKYAMACPGSTRLQRFGSISEASADGNARHEYLAALFLGDDDAVASIYSEMRPELRKEVSEYDLSGVPVMRWRLAEVAFAFNPETGKARVVGFNIGRDYAANGVDMKREFAGTADYVGASYDGRLIVGDWKTGNAYTVDHVSENWQLKFLADCVLQTQADLIALAPGSESGNQEFTEVDAYITRTKGEMRSEVRTFTAFDIDSFTLELKALGEYIHSSAPPKFVEGSHCQWCPSFDSCPAKTSLVRAMSSAPETFAGEIGAITSSNVREAYARYRIAKMALRKVEARLQAYAAKEPIQLSGGKVFGPVVRKDEDIDPAIAGKVLAETIGPQEALKAFDMSVNKTGIKKAISGAVEKGMGAQTFRHVMSTIGARGGIVERDRTEMREHTPGEQEA